MIEEIPENPTAIIITNEELKKFPLRSSTRQGYPLLPLLFNIVSEVTARKIRPENKIKGIQMEGKEAKLSRRLHLEGSLAMARLLVPTCQNITLASRARRKEAWGLAPVQAPIAGLHWEKVQLPLHLSPRSLLTKTGGSPIVSQHCQFKFERWIKKLQGHSFSRTCSKVLGRSTCWKTLDILTFFFHLNDSDYNVTFLQPFKVFEA